MRAASRHRPRQSLDRAISHLAGGCSPGKTMAVLRHETVAPCADAAQSGCAHSASDRAVKGVALQTHELGKRFVSAKKFAVGNEIDLRARLLGGQAEAAKISQLPCGNVDGHTRAFLTMRCRGRAESAVAVEHQSGACGRGGHAASQPRAAGGVLSAVCDARRGHNQRPGNPRSTLGK